MGVWIALFRSINVGGNNVVPMAALRALMTSIGFDDVKTYIQSGNAVFRSGGDAPEIEEKLAKAVETEFGFVPQVMVLSLSELTTAMEANPFPEAVGDPKSLHLYFAATQPEAPDTKAMENWKKDSEAYVLKDKVFYLHAPEGIGRSKLAERVGKLLGVACTARNWRSVCKIQSLAGDF